MAATRRLQPARLKLAGSAALVLVVALWLITPTPKALYHPADHVIPRSAGDAADSGDIQNSIIVPSYNEAENMAPLVTRIFQSLPPDSVRHTEVLVIDDNSQDATSEQIEQLRESGYNVHLHVRTVERGLSSAVLYGFALSKGNKLVVMDADLQHPPESVPLLLNALEGEGSKFALGTRYGKGVEMDRDWPLYRRIISWGARILSRPLTNAQDPMGGFFALKKDLYLASQPLNPSGFKLGLELLLKTPLTSSELVHVPYGFSKRQSGSSKLGMKVIIKYVGQLLALYYWRFGLLWLLFVGVVAAGGVYALLEMGDLLVRRIGVQDSRLGRAVIGDKRKRRKTKSDV